MKRWSFDERIILVTVDKVVVLRELHCRWRVENLQFCFLVGVVGAQQQEAAGRGRAVVSRSRAWSLELGRVPHFASDRRIE